MKSIHESLVRHIVCLATGVSLAVASGCSFGSSGKATTQFAETTSGDKNATLTGGAICLQEMFKETSAPFHASFTQSSSDQKVSNIEADVTPAEIDYTKRETGAGKTVSSTKHLRRDEFDEMELDFQVMRPVPWHGELMPAEGATKAEGHEKVDGYAAVKYSIDTARKSAAEKRPFLALMGANDYRVSGSAWLADNNGCLVKWNLDTQKNNQDGSVERAHFEGDVTKR